jgi:HEAT repeat protein
MRRARDRHRTVLFAAVAAVAALYAAGAARGGGTAGETLRWRFDTVAGYVYRLGGPQATKILPDEIVERTVYAADIREGREVACPPGRITDLLFAYAFRLPEAPVESGASWPVDEIFGELPAGPIAAKGEGRIAARKGPVWRIDWTVAFSQAGSGRFERGNLRVGATFHQKKGALASAEFSFDGSEREGQGSKPFSFKGTIDLARPISADPRDLGAAVDKAIARGVEILKTSVKKAEYRRFDRPLGYLSICLYALLKAGVDEQDALVRQGFEDLDRFPPLGDEVQKPPDTYSVALAALAIEAKSSKRGKAGTGGTTSVRLEKAETSRRDLERLETLARWLTDGRAKGHGVWSYGSWLENRKDQRGDASLTQFATLALHACSRAGVSVPPEVFAEIARAYLRHQERDGPPVAAAIEVEPGAGVYVRLGRARTSESREGPRARGWSYMAPTHHPSAYASMTGAGVSSLLICWHELEKAKSLDPDLAAEIERGLRDGLAWLERHHTMRANWPEYSWQPIYHLYSLEKAFEIGGIARIGGHDWWAEGAWELLGREKQGMPGGWGGVDQTALALLFLTRATREPELEVRKVGRSESGGAPAAGDEFAVVVEGLGLVSARDALLATESRDPEKRRERLEIAEKAFRALQDERQPALAPELGRLLDSSYPECARLAAKLLQEVAGERVKDRAAAQAFGERFVETTRDGASGDPAVIPRVRERLKDPLPGVRRAAALALSRLRAIEAVPDLIDAIERDPKLDADYLGALLAGLIGKDATPESPLSGGRAALAERWRKVWAEEKNLLLRREEVRRAVRDLSRAEETDAAKERLRKIGRPAVRALIEALADERVRSEAAALLEEITGKSFGGDKEAWEAWWRAEGSQGG